MATRARHVHRPSKIASWQKSLNRLSLNEHRVAVAEKAIALFDCFGIGSADQGVATERPDQNQQRASRQMKVRKHRIAGLKFEWRPDEKIGLASKGLNLSARGSCFQRAHDRGAYGNDTPVGPFAFPQSFSNHWRE